MSISDSYQILIVDDHPLMRRGIMQLIAFESDLEVIADVSDGAKALELLKMTEPDLILLDLNMQPMSGLETLRRLREGGCTSKVVMLTVSDDSKDLFELLRAGADGYLLKDLEPESLIEAIKVAVSGQKVINPQLEHLLLQEEPERFESAEPLEALTAREEQVLELIAKGKPNKTIANELSISESTVKVHVKNLLRKLNLRSRTEAAVWRLNK